MIAFFDNDVSEGVCSSPEERCKTVPSQSQWLKMVPKWSQNGPKMVKNVQNLMDPKRPSESLISLIAQPSSNPSKHF